MRPPQSRSSWDFQQCNALGTVLINEELPRYARQMSLHCRAGQLKPVEKALPASQPSVIAAPPLSQQARQAEIDLRPPASFLAVIFWLSGRKFVSFT